MSQRYMMSTDPSILRFGAESGQSGRDLTRPVAKTHHLRIVSVPDQIHRMGQPRVSGARLGSAEEWFGPSTSRTGGQLQCSPCAIGQG